MFSLLSPDSRAWEKLPETWGCTRRRVIDGWSRLTSTLGDADFKDVRRLTGSARQECPAKMLQRTSACTSGLPATGTTAYAGLMGSASTKLAAASCSPTPSRTFMSRDASHYARDEDKK